VLSTMASTVSSSTAAVWLRLRSPEDPAGAALEEEEEEEEEEDAWTRTVVRLTRSPPPPRACPRTACSP
jgi:hypothetical protein